MREVRFKAILPARAEMTDVTNKCHRLILDFAVFYDEQEITLDALDVMIEGMIEQDKPYVLPESQEEYRLDDVVFVGPHRARLHLSRPLKTA